ncbi:FAD/NAD(P)-binding protein [Allosalinactinospora lopnorensis]|uniref:FAD/NAD(P)-binding protein n=1 Tax=Allosalinactinospora lopnorensis TaxID=1352348 RepID=UPI000623CC35|nr:FAD/NAD(P)-binding protein [Allosalinactinospora lopnorensis]
MEHQAASADPVIAFAGGGASATLAAVALLRTTTWLRLSYRMLVFDEYGRHARGPAYAASDDRQLLRTSVKGMSAFPDRPCHLLEWARWRGLPCDPDTHLSLRVYGDYLAETLAETVSWARPHATLQRRTARVVGASADNGLAEVRLAQGERLPVAAVVVATGDPAAHAPPRITGIAAGDAGTELVTCPKGALITGSGEASRRLFALGPVRRDHRADGIPQIRVQAEELAQRIADTVLRDRAPAS